AHAEIVARAQDVLAGWNLWDYRDELVANLSYGVQRQLEIVLALAGNPKLLLLDEADGRAFCQRDASRLRHHPELGPCHHGAADRARSCRGVPYRRSGDRDGPGPRSGGRNAE